jgi:hypothetical protein
VQALKPRLYGSGLRHTRQAVMEDIFDAIVLILIWIANGGLVVIFWLIDHLLLLAAIPAFYLLVAQARQEQRLYALAAGGLSLLASILVPPPIPVLATCIIHSSRFQRLIQVAALLSPGWETFCEMVQAAYQMEPSVSRSVGASNQCN